jgi:hypothetical protein
MKHMPQDGKGFQPFYMRFIFFMIFMNQQEAGVATPSRTASSALLPLQPCAQSRVALASFRDGKSRRGKTGTAGRHETGVSIEDVRTSDGRAL